MEENTEKMTESSGMPKWLLVGGVIVVVVGIFLYSRFQSSQKTQEENVTAESATDKGVTTNVQFGNHIQMGLPEQAVYIEDDKNPAQVWRVEGDAQKKLDPTVEAKTVYAAAASVPPDPFKVGANPLGPFQKGKSLGFTMAKWLGATGSGTYVASGEDAQLSLTFQNLVPSGVYTVWCSRLTLPPNVAIVDKPCGAADGSENSFTADASGNGAFSLKMKALEASTKETVSVLALTYHSDGKTYGADPGQFGLYSHVQLAFLLPAPSEAGQ